PRHGNGHGAGRADAGPGRQVRLLARPHQPEAALVRRGLAAVLRGRGGDMSRRVTTDPFHLIVLAPPASASPTGGGSARSSTGPASASSWSGPYGPSSASTPSWARCESRSRADARGRPPDHA